MSLDMSDIHKSPQRSASTREYRGPILRHKISAPIQLVHTTNMLSYNAPDLPNPSIGNSSVKSSSVKSDVDSESNSLAESTPPTSPDVSPADECPSPVPNHLSSYFMAPERAFTPSPKIEQPPAIPQRSPSHTKKNSYDAIARQRSISRMSKESEHTLASKASFSFSRSSSTSTRASSVSSTTTGERKLAPPPVFAPPAFQQRSYAKEPHPFGHELAQVTELAEEYGAKDTSLVGDKEAQSLKEKGLFKFTADDYINEIESIFTTFLHEATTHARSATPLWI